MSDLWNKPSKAGSQSYSTTSNISNKSIELCLLVLWRTCVNIVRMPTLIPSNFQVLPPESLESHFDYKSHYSVAHPMLCLTCVCIHSRMLRLILWKFKPQTTSWGILYITFKIQPLEHTKTPLKISKFGYFAHIRNFKASYLIARWCLEKEWSKKSKACRLLILIIMSTEYIIKDLNLMYEK